MRFSPLQRACSCINVHLYGVEGGKAGSRGDLNAWVNPLHGRVLAVLALWQLIWRFRLRYASGQLTARYKARIDERSKIARDLHDTMLQALQASKVVANTALNEKLDEESLRYALEKVSGWLDQALREGRRALGSLRSAPPGG